MAADDHQDELEIDVETWAAQFTDLDAMGVLLLDQIRGNEAILRGLKYEYGQALLRFQEGDAEEMPSPLEFLQIKKIERELHNDKTFLEARELTRRHG